MAPKKSHNTAAAAAATFSPATKTTTTTTITSNTSTSTTTSTSKTSSSQVDKIALNVLQHYQKNTPQRTKLIDAFMAFLVIVGGLQFAYCVLAGNYVCPESHSL